MYRSPSATTLTPRLVRVGWNTTFTATVLNTTDPSVPIFSQIGSNYAMRLLMHDKRDGQNGKPVEIPVNVSQATRHMVLAKLPNTLTDSMEIKQGEPVQFIPQISIDNGTHWPVSLDHVTVFS